MARRGNAKKYVRSKSAPSNKRSEYARARKQLDGSKFIVVTNTEAECLIPGEAASSTVAVCPAMNCLVRTEMFQQIQRMYDEFRIRSLRVKITAVTGAGLGSSANTCNMITAFDRNGFFMFTDPSGIYREHYVDPATYIPQVSLGTLMSYSSKQTKQLLMYQSSATSRSIAAAGGPDSFFFPTEFGKFLQANNLPVGQAKMVQDLINNGYNPSGVAPHGFMPTLLIGVDGNGATVTSNREIQFRLDWEFDVVVRGLRQQQ